MNIEQANETLNRAGLAVRDLIQRAYEAGTRPISARVRIEPMPSADEINKALSAFDRAAVALAHARMEETAKRCGFEGLTEALGYLITLRDNPLAELLREAVNLCAIGDITPSRDPAAEGGWSNWLMRAKAVVGDTAPPPETITLRKTTDGVSETDAELLARRRVGMLPQLAAGFESNGPHEGREGTWPQMAGRFKRPENQVLSGCAVRAAIQVDNTMPEGFAPTASALRGRDGSGKWLAANVHDPLYSTVSMLATEYYDGEKWVPVGSEEDARNGGGATTS